jgi:hypothetical protein
MQHPHDSVVLLGCVLAWRLELARNLPSGLSLLIPDTEDTFAAKGKSIEN